jgi:hypothetical protein
MAVYLLSTFVCIMQRKRQSTDPSLHHFCVGHSHALSMNLRMMGGSYIFVDKWFSLKKHDSHPSVTVKVNINMDSTTESFSRHHGLPILYYGQEKFHPQFLAYKGQVLSTHVLTSMENTTTAYLFIKAKLIIWTKQERFYSMSLH